VIELRYGDDPSQFAELYLPSVSSAAVPVAVYLHGGFWRSKFDLSGVRPLAESLAQSGWAALNVEYRRVGNGGGHPATFADVGAAIDSLAIPGTESAAVHGAELDLSRVVAVGHSAGGHLAAWSATRQGAKVDVTGVVSQAGVMDLVRAAADELGERATQAFLGGEPSEVPDRYRFASPIEHLPLGVPILCVHGRDDQRVPLDQSEAFVRAAIAAGDQAELAVVAGDHFVVIDTASDAWAAVLRWLDDLRDVP